MGEVLTAEEVAERLRISESLVYRYAREGLLASVSLGRAVRFLADDVDAFLRANRRAPFADAG